MGFSEEYGKHMSKGDDGDHWASEWHMSMSDISVAKYPRQLKAGEIMTLVGHKDMVNEADHGGRVWCG